MKYLVTSDSIPGRQIEATLGLVRGSSVRARHLGHDMTALFKNIVGGELDEYTKLMGEVREQALDRIERRNLISVVLRTRKATKATRNVA